jgi:hypothetical protein
VNVKEREERRGNIKDRANRWKKLKKRKMGKEGRR